LAYAEFTKYVRNVTNTFPSPLGTTAAKLNMEVLVSYNELEYENEFVDDETDYSTFMQLCFTFLGRSV
jgi:hypothetical protein